MTDMCPENCESLESGAEMPANARTCPAKARKRPRFRPSLRRGRAPGRRHRGRHRGPRRIRGGRIRDGEIRGPRGGSGDGRGRPFQGPFPRAVFPARLRTSGPSGAPADRPERAPARRAAPARGASPFGPAARSPPRYFQNKEKARTAGAPIVPTVPLGPCRSLYGVGAVPQGRGAGGREGGGRCPGASAVGPADAPGPPPALLPQPPRGHQRVRTSRRSSPRKW